MVIVVEEQKNKMSLVSILTWLTILGILAAATYYIFFKEPATVEYIAPVNLSTTKTLARITLDPNSILNDPSFKALKSYVTVPKVGNAGRQNPFLPFEGFPITPAPGKTAKATTSTSTSP